MRLPVRKHLSKKRVEWNIESVERKKILYKMKLSFKSEKEIFSQTKTEGSHH